MSNFYADEVQRQIDQIQDPEERSRRQAEYDDLSVFRDILPFIPLNVKQYAYYMMGGKGELDENDLTDAELNVLYDIARQKLNDPNFSPSRYSDSNKITYPDYKTGDYSDISRGNPASKEVHTQEQLNAWEKGEIKLNLEGPEGKMKSYSYEEYLQDYPGIFDDPLSVVELAKKLKDPNYSMKTTIGKADIVSNEDDTYSVQDQYDFEYGRGTGESNYDSFSLSPYAVARNLAAKRKNEGSPVDINLGSEEYIKRQGMYNGGEASYLQSALEMLTESAPVTQAPEGTFDLGSIEPINPIMDRYKPNPLDEFAMMMADPTKKLKVISTPVKMQLKPLFAKRNKFKQLIDKQKFNYERGQDLASKTDPDAIDQGNYMMNAAIKSGKRFQQQLNDVEEKIRKIYQSK
jgi:hypothetical protein